MKAVIVKKVRMQTSPQFVLIVKSGNFYCLHVIGIAVDLDAGDELSSDAERRGVWRISRTGELYQGNFIPNFSLSEAEEALCQLVNS
ncbi:hypothetical protein [Obesumbacterium proteus]|uniref:hypothetical protein n=1 Tax=Obesumbacterium proteus TaxID=82983 RepID=UPI001F191B14|nr:hypothetical protein [Obesumbacterium proteus]MCE9886493.1 hypothetical protein [Obesumbacterium proteus]